MNIYIVGFVLSDRHRVSTEDGEAVGKNAIAIEYGRRGWDG